MMVQTGYHGFHRRPDVGNPLFITSGITLVIVEEPIVLLTRGTILNCCHMFTDDVDSCTVK